MSVPDKSIVVRTLSKKYDCILSTITGKQIMYQGVSGKQRIVVCSPSSKLHVRGHGWFDLTIKQVGLLDYSDIAILAVRLEGNKLYYIDFKELRKLMSPDNLLRNSNEGEHWKIYIWETYILVRGNKQNFFISPQLATEEVFI